MAALKFDPPLNPALQEMVEGYYAEAGKKWTAGIAGFLAFDRNLEPTKTRQEYKAGAYGFEASVTGYESSAPCHAMLTYVCGKNTAIVVAAMKKSLSDKNKDYLLWIARESPWSHGIVNRDDEEGLLTQGFVMDTGILGQRNVLRVCKALRYTSEDTWRAKTWKTLMDAGCEDGLMAFIGASIIANGGGASWGTTHNSLCGYDEPKQLRKTYDKFKEEGGKKYNDSSATISARYYSYQSNKPDEWGTLKGRKVKKDDGWGGYTEVQEPGNAKQFARQLNCIKEGKFDDVAKQ